MEFRNVTIGGGTALAARWHHRKSNDIDLFLPNPRDIREIVAQRSQILRDLRSHNSDISAFIEPDESAVAHPCHPTVITWMPSRSRTAEPLSSQYEPITGFPLETNAEILSKKLHYRILQHQLILPDTWQLAHPDAVIEEPSDPELARNCLDVLINGLPARPGGPQR